MSAVRKYFYSRTNSRGGGGVHQFLFYFLASRGLPLWPGAPKQLRGPRQLRGMPNGMRRLCIYIKPVSSRLRTGRTGIRADGRGAAASRGPFGPANHGAACLSGSRGRFVATRPHIISWPTIKHLYQTWALYGPRAKYGPRDGSDRPAKDYMIIKKRKKKENIFSVCVD